MRIYRLEFLQPDGRWTGPYTAEWMTPTAFKLREAMLNDHKITRPYPISSTFAENPGIDRYVCASPSDNALRSWFGPYLELFQTQGGHVGIYEIPQAAIAGNDGQQVVYQQRQATLVSREGNSIDRKLLVEKLHPLKLENK